MKRFKKRQERFKFSTKSFRDYDKKKTYPLTTAGSHHIRIDWHCTTWFGGSIENTNVGDTLFVESKQDVSWEAVTDAATLVPPEPKVFVSLTWEGEGRLKKMVSIPA